MASTFHENLAPVYETVRRLRAELPAETTLIGFCGAPWTVATYMIAGHGTPDQAPARLFAYRHPEAMARAAWDAGRPSAAYLIRQIEAGADAVQIFDSWSGVLDEETFERLLREAGGGDGRAVREALSGCADHRLSQGRRQLAMTTSASGRGVRRLVSTGPCRWRRQRLQSRARSRAISTRCGWSPAGRRWRKACDAILDVLGDGPLVFNLGHGITPETPIAHVEAMIAR